MEQVQTNAAPTNEAPQAPVEASQQEIATKDATKAAKPAKEAKVEVPKAEDKYEIKINGKTKLVNRDELIRLAQLSEAANERFESAAQKEKRINQLIGKAKESPIQALMDPELGLTKEEIRAKMEDWYNREFIEPETLTKEQRELKEAKEKLAFYQKAEAEQQERLRKEAESKAESEYAEKFQKEIIDAVEKNKLPKTKGMVKKIAFYMRQNLLNGFDAPMELIIQKVKEDRKNELTEFNDYDYDQIVDAFGEEFIAKLLSENLKRIRDKRASTGKSFSSKELEPGGKKPEKISMAEAAKRLKAMRTGH
jgi:hypothetical protein